MRPIREAPPPRREGSLPRRTRTRDRRSQVGLARSTPQRIRRDPTTAVACTLGPLGRGRRTRAVTVAAQEAPPLIPEAPRPPRTQLVPTAAVLEAAVLVSTAAADAAASGRARRRRSESQSMVVENVLAPALAPGAHMAPTHAPTRTRALTIQGTPGPAQALRTSRIRTYPRWTRASCLC